MKIDIHTHLAYHGVYSPDYLSGMLAGNPELSPGGIEILCRAFLRDKDGRMQIAEMDKAGIDKSVILIIDSGLRLQPPAINLEEVYLLHSKILTQFPDRFIVFSGIDPRRGEAYEMFVKSIESYGCRGLKLYPPMGFPMDHEVLLRMYEYCQQHRLPVLIHTGDSLPSLSNEFSQVKNAVSIAGQFPALTFILAHAGYQPEEPGMSALATCSNVFFDIAGIQSLVHTSHNPFSALTSEEIDMLAEKIVFGSDTPLFSFMNPLSRQITTIKEYLQRCGFTSAQIDKIFCNPSLYEKILL